MKITRYFQSCLLVEEDNVRILIDPSGQEKDRMSKFGELDAVLYTHEHADHFDADMAQTFVEAGIAPVYANTSTAKLIKASKTVVKNGQELQIKGVKIKVLELPHCLMPDGSKGPLNVGFLINDKLFHPGDGKELAGLKVQILAVPMLGPDVSIKDACDFAKQVSMATAIPIHYDSFGAKPDFFVNVSKLYDMPFNVMPLSIGKTVEL
jgi:L-ascorbate metabolism protein UlaG (beta-lactamase superfamily)